MQILVNSKAQSMADHASVADLVMKLGLGASPCAVEVNKRLVPKREHADTRLDEGDTVEIVTLVGGG